MKELKLEKETITFKSIGIGVLIILIYIFIPLIIAKMVSNLTAYLIINSILLIVLCSLIFFKRFKRDFILFKRDFKSYFYYIIKNQFIMYTIYFLISIFSILILKSYDTSINQQKIESLPTITIVLTSLIYAPIVEELVFRGAFRKIVGNNIIFIVVSGVIFGLLHTISEMSLLEFFIRGLPYVSIGCYLAYLYTKTENICVCMTAHFIHNLMGVILLLGR